MAETRELQVLRCPACNAKFTNFSVYKKTVTCPACHNVITNPVAETRKEDMPERMIPSLPRSQTSRVRLPTP